MCNKQRDKRSLLLRFDRNIELEILHTCLGEGFLYLNLGETASMSNDIVCPVFGEEAINIKGIILQKIQNKEGPSGPKEGAKSSRYSSDIVEVVL